MAQKTEVSVPGLFADLQRHIQNGDYDKALKASNKILQETPKDDKAFHCKVVSLIQLGKFEDVLVVLRKNQDLGSELSFEKAYCEYRLNRTSEALRTLRGVEEPDTRIQELLGQVLYRQEQHEESLEVYKMLMKNTQDDFEEERETNMSAVLAAMQTATLDHVEDLGLREDTYELCYNAACYQLGDGQHQAALDKLQQAEKVCRAQFADDPDTTEEEIDAELGVIRVQMGYALQRLGKVDEANKLYNQVSKQRPDDIALNAVVSNNIITLNKDQNVFDSKKKIKAATTQRLQQKLTSQQREAIAMNQCLLYMYMNQGDMCRKTAQALQKTYPDTDTPSLIEAAQYCRDKQLPKAIEALKKQISSSKGNALDLKLTLTQLQLSQGQVYDACTTLRSLGDYSHKPGVVSALVSLYVSQEDKEAASEVLQDTIQWHKTNKPDSPELVSLIRANANFQLRMGSPQVATQMLEELRKRDPKDMKTLAHLISAYSKFDPKKAQAASKALPAPDNLAQEVDVDSLEQGINVLSQKYSKKAGGRGDTSPVKPQSPKAGEELALKKKHKKRKVRLPKNYDPKETPDTERWLPLRERSYYRGRRHKRRDGGIGKGTQGAAPAFSDLDASGASGAGDPNSPRSRGGTSSPANQSGASSGGATPSQTPQPGASGAAPRQQKPAPKGQKKKKKGGKW